MSFTIEIKAESLVNAINNLANAISSQGNAVSNVSSPQPAIEVQPPAQNNVVPTAPTQQGPQAQEPAQQPIDQAPTVPTTAPSYSLDQLAVAATQLMDAGKRVELLQLLNSFGVQALTALPPEQFGAFATKLREMGAKI